GCGVPCPLSSAGAAHAQRVCRAHYGLDALGRVEKIVPLRMQQRASLHWAQRCTPPALQAEKSVTTDEGRG
ncbi:MAG: hypothetical protein ACK56I_03250, partial [bacterium]